MMITETFETDHTGRRKTHKWDNSLSRNLTLQSVWCLCVFSRYDDLSATD